LKKKIQDHYKYNQLISALRQKIYAGDFDQDGKLPPERTLAQSFGFSRVTVRSALQELEEDGLIERRPGVATFVKTSRKAPPESQHREYRFCFICRPSPMGLAPEDDPYNSQLLLGFFKAKNRENMFSLDTLVIPNDFASLHDYARKQGINLKQWDGLILSHAPTPDEINDLIHDKINFVVLGETDSMRYFPVITVDNFSGAYMLTSHLLQQGKQEPLFLFVNKNNLWEKRRVAGFFQALSEAGIATAPERIIRDCPADLAATRRYLKELLRRRRPFDALVVTGDIRGCGVLEELAAAGIRVPEDVAVGLYDGYHWIANMFPHVPCLAQPFASIGETAIKMLKERLANPESAISIEVIMPQLLTGPGGKP
jgi:DNA-binding LacI/PurR family transcriptional regulator